MADVVQPGFYPEGPARWPGLFLGLAAAAAAFAAGNWLSGAPLLHLSPGWLAVAVGQGAAVALLVLMGQEWHRLSLFRRDLAAFQAIRRAPLVEETLKVILGRVGFAKQYETLKRLVEQEAALEQEKQSLQERCARALSAGAEEWRQSVERRWWLYLGLALLVFAPASWAAVTARMPSVAFTADPFLVLDVATGEGVVLCLAGLCIRRGWVRLLGDWQRAALTYGVLPALARLQFRPPPPPPPRPQPPTVLETQVPRPMETLPAVKPPPLPPPVEKPASAPPPPASEPAPPVNGTAQAVSTRGPAETTSALPAEKMDIKDQETNRDEPEEQPPPLPPEPETAPVPPDPETGGDLSFGGGGD